MPFDFDTVLDRYNTNCVKYDSATKPGYPADILPLWVADMDFKAPQCVTDALRKVVEHGIYSYSITSDGYYEAVCNWFRNRFDWQVEKEWVVKTPGVVIGVAAGVRIMTQPGDAIIIMTPVYAPFYEVVRRNDRKLVESAMCYENGRYTIDFVDVEAKIRENEVKAMILCSPHNPVGRVWTLEELQELGRICYKYGVQVISDEIHCDFTMPGYPHTPFIKACPELAESAMVCTAPSKSFNLAGLEASNIFIPGEKLRQAYQRELNRIYSGGLNCMGIAGCQAAYEGGAQWLDACKAYIYENRDYVRKFLQENIPQVKLVESEGTYFAWLDFTELGMTEEELNNMIVFKAKLRLIDGGTFGKEAAMFQRMILACPRAIMEKAMNQLKAAICG